MDAGMEIKVQKCAKSRINEIDFNNLGFGSDVTDHMFMADYVNGAWTNAQILPFQNISIAPTMLALHYGQTVFEGLKAFRMKDGKMSIFRLDAHHKRFNNSLKRMCIPEIPYNLFAPAIEKLIATDEAWLKDIESASLYIRPFVFATEERFGVKISSTYKFIVFTGAVGDYYSKPLKVKVEDKYVRASKGGTGFAKCGGNYGGAFFPTQQAKQEGFDQVLWTDGSENYNIEESGTMNAMFVFEGVIVTPQLSDSILGGITRDSLIQLAKDLNYKIEERTISAYELKKKLEEGKVDEAFGTGTAAVTAPIESISIFGTNYALPKQNENGKRATLHKLLFDIRHGKQADTHNWNHVI